MRTRELGAIHTAKRDLGLDEETYRNMLWSVGRVHSAADLDAQGRQKVIEHLRGLGWRPAAKRRRPRPAPDRADLVRKIRAQLMAAKRPDTYGDGMARHMFGIERYEWCTPDQLMRIVAALAIDAKRHGRAR